jgi:uncharacterized protein YyaL (SSP411 family)
MAAEAFSDPQTAAFLNGNFVNVKVDRETRPDIDQYLMSFMQAQSGSGGWPLNVFLTPDLRPVLALTYAPARGRSGMAPLLSIAGRVLGHMKENGDGIPTFEPFAETPAPVQGDMLPQAVLAPFDALHGGFGSGQKFPPHATLLYGLYRLADSPHARLERAARLTLDAMRRGGLHDHLQGGFFRYCVDRAWRIPHFEKMLYDQALALWTYALAGKVLKDEAYGKVARSVVRCLEETFALGDLFATALDADTEHREGATYTWDRDEIASALTAEEFRRFSASYLLPEPGNFEGRIHLARLDDRPLGDSEAKLLAVRRLRPQPFRDEKVICGLNAITACALVQAARLLAEPALEERAASVTRRLLDVFWDGEGVAHSLAAGAIQGRGFLSDAAALLLALTLLREGDERWQAAVEELSRSTRSFERQGQWIESSQRDFQAVPASWFDHPIPSPVSLASLGLARAAVLAGALPDRLDYRQAHACDFFNVAAMFSQGRFHQFHSRRPLDWERLPANSIQVRDENESDCYAGACRPIQI